MTRRIRTAIFISLALVFLVAAPITVIYSLGWRFDWEEKKVIQPGIFYFKVWPKSSQIYIDGEAEKKTDIFFGSAWIEGLKAGEHSVKIEKEGYHSWQKNLEIIKRGVTKAENITLIPQAPTIDLLFENVEDFFFSSNEEKIVLKETTEEGWALKLFDPKKNIKSHLLSPGELRLGSLTPIGEKSSEDIELISLEFLTNSRDVIIKVGAKEKIYHFIINTDTSAITSLENVTGEEIIPHPREKEKVFVLSKNELLIFDLEDKKSSIVLENISKAIIHEDKIYHLDKDGFIFKSSLSGDNRERLNIIPFEIKEETKYDLKILDNNIFLIENDALYFLDQENTLFEKLLDNFNGIKLSNDKKKLVYFNNREIWVKFLEKRYEQPQRKEGEKVFINRFSEEISQLFWYNNHYLIFSINNKIDITEIDDRDRLNIVTLVEYKDPKIFFSNKKLYILSEKNFYASEELTN